MNNFEKRIVDLSAKYDDETPFKKPKLTATDKYKLYKSVANQQEKKEFRDIERKYNSKPVTPVVIDIAPLPKQLTFEFEEVKPVRTTKMRDRGLAYLLGGTNENS